MGKRRHRRLETDEAMISNLGDGPSLVLINLIVAKSLINSGTGKRGQLEWSLQHPEDTRQSRYNPQKY